MKTDAERRSAADEMLMTVSYMHVEDRVLFLEKIRDLMTVGVAPRRIDPEPRTESPLTYADLMRLCDELVPRASRWRESFPLESYWPAHELAHMLIAGPGDIGLPEFGIVRPRISEHDAYCLELAANKVARKLLVTAGCEPIADRMDVEIPASLQIYDDQGDVDRLIYRRCAYVPITAASLRDLLERRFAWCRP